MNINEVTQPSAKALFEAIDASNDSGISTADLVSVIQARAKPRTTATLDEMLMLIDQTANG